MPALTLFGTRTFVAGDDLKCYSNLLLILRLAQFSILIPLFVYSRDFNAADHLCKQKGLKARGDFFLSVYAGLALVQVFLALPIEILIRQASLKGAPTEPEKRKMIKPLCYIKLVPMTALRASTFGLGMVVLGTLNDFCSCKGNLLVETLDFVPFRALRCGRYGSLMALTTALFIMHATEVAGAAFLYLCFIFQKIKLGSFFAPLLGTPQFRWQICCRLCCTLTSFVTCCVFGGRQAVTGDLADVTMALTDFLDGRLDVVASDVLAGLLIVARLQKEKREECEKHIKHKLASLLDRTGGNLLDEENQTRRRSSITSSTLVRNGVTTEFQADEQVLLSGRIESDRKLIEDAAHYMRIATGIYGYIMYMINHTTSGIACLVGKSLLCQRSCDGSKIKGDNILGCHEIAFLRETGMSPDCVAYISFEASASAIPYGIVIDSERKRIVVAIRGTLSLEDAVKDLMIHPIDLEEVGDISGFEGRQRYAHAGMLESALWVAKDIKETEVLDRLLKIDEYTDYQLLITGHSLGAGCAALLSIMLHDKYPSLLCLCFEPPGCVVSENLSWCHDFIVSFVLGDDIVPRLSYDSLKNLRDEVLETVARMKVPKHKIFDLFRRRTGEDIDYASLSEKMLHKTDEVPVTKFGSELASFREHQHGR